MDTPSHPSITLSAEQRIEDGVIYTDDVAQQRAIAYDMLREFSAKRAAYYRDSSKINLKKLLGKDVIMFAARGVATAGFTISVILLVLNCINLIAGIINLVAFA